MWETNKGTIECDKSEITCNVGTAQCDDETVKCEKKKKGTTECGRSTFIFEVGTAWCDNETIKCEKKMWHFVPQLKIQGCTTIKMNELFKCDILLLL